jgi:AraC family transcriptional regulator, melibiose operon regulatory protein
VTLHTGHRHNEVELAIFDRHPITVLYGGSEVIMPPGRLAVFWGVIPHLPLRVVAGTEGFGLRIPLPWLLEWDLPQVLTRRLLKLEVLTDDSPDDLVQMKDWVQLAASGDASRRQIVLLEVQARLRRLAINSSARSRRPGPQCRPDRPISSAFDGMVEFIASRYMRDINVDDVAGAGSITRIHAMRVFRNATGVTIHQYITQQRVCHAQQMLATTQIGMEEVSRQSGFPSLTRFYSSFKKVVGQSPAHHRRTLRDGSPQERPEQGRRRRAS